MVSLNYTSQLKKLIKIFLLLTFLPFLLCAQDAPIKKENAPFIIKAHVAIPKTITSNQFRQSFNGFYEADFSLNIKLTGNFYLGVGYQNSYFQNNQFLKQKVFNASIPYNTRLIGDCPFVKLSYDKFLKQRIYINYSLNYGYMLARYSNINEDTSAQNKPFGPKTFTGQYIQPEVSFNFIIPGEGASLDGRLAFSVIFSYTTLFCKYDPKGPRFNQFDEVNTKSNHYFMSWLAVGFGINILIGKNKK
jgi:hypothetical protein